MNLKTIGTAFSALLLAACASTPGSDVDAEAAQEYFEEGRVEAGRGNHTVAIDLYSDALGENPEYPTAYYERAYSRIQLRLSRPKKAVAAAPGPPWRTKIGSGA